MELDLKTAPDDRVSNFYVASVTMQTSPQTKLWAYRFAFTKGGRSLPSSNNIEIGITPVFDLCHLLTLTLILYIVSQF